MPKSKASLAVRLNLLKPQSNPEKIPVRIITWLLSSGRYIFAAVNAVVLIAFVTRFKLDADLATKNEAITEQIPYIESLRPYEILIRNTQLKLSTIDTAKRNAIDWPLLLKKISDQVPQSVTIIGINIDNNIGTANIHIAGQTKFNSDIASFITGLKGDNAFGGVTLSSVSLEQDSIKFGIDIQSKLAASGGRSL